MKITLIDFEDNSYHFTVNIVINEINATFLLDTGATNSVVFKRFYEEHFKQEVVLQSSDIAASASGQNMKTGSVIVDSIKIGTKDLTNIKMGCMDMEHIENIYMANNKGRIDGMIGADLMYDLKMKLDFSALELSY